MLSCGSHLSSVGEVESMFEPQAGNTLQGHLTGTALHHAQTEHGLKTHKHTHTQTHTHTPLEMKAPECPRSPAGFPAGLSLIKDIDRCRTMRGRKALIRQPGTSDKPDQDQAKLDPDLDLNLYLDPGYRSMVWVLEHSKADPCVLPVSI